MRLDQPTRARFGTGNTSPELVGEADNLPLAFTCRVNEIMQTSSLVTRPARPAPIHAFAPPDEGEHQASPTEAHAEVAPRLRPQAASLAIASRAKPQAEPLPDWQVFALLGGTAGGFLSLGLAALYGVSLLLP
jgi:hypothetical protein